MMLVGPSLTGLLQRPPLRQPLPLQGFGGAVTGGAGGTIYPVTNNNDSGAGSLRQAVLDVNAAGGPAIIDIQVGGYITLDDNVDLDSVSDVTITGENAPSVVALRANQSSQWNDPLLQMLNCSNILVEQLRLYRGLGDPNGGNSKCLFTDGDSSNVAFRFCSLAWAEDQLTTLRAVDCTFQYCMFYEALEHAHHSEDGGETQQAHSNLILVSPSTTDPVRLTFDKCVFAHAQQRMPWWCVRPEIDTANCIAYNFGINDSSAEKHGGGFAEQPNSVRSSIWLSGPNTPSNSRPTWATEGVYVDDVLWIKDDGTEETDPANIVTTDTVLLGSPPTFSQPPPVAVTLLAKEDLWVHLQPLVGATSPARSATDARILSHVANAINKVSLDGSFIDNPADEDTNVNPNASRTAYATWAEAL